jgi:hypothetical protein
VLVVSGQWLACIDHNAAKPQPKFRPRARRRPRARIGGKN